MRPDRSGCSRMLPRRGRMPNRAAAGCYPDLAAGSNRAAAGCCRRGRIESGCSRMLLERGRIESGCSRMLPEHGGSNRAAADTTQTQPDRIGLQPDATPTQPDPVGLQRMLPRRSRIRSGRSRMPPRRSRIRIGPQPDASQTRPDRIGLRPDATQSQPDRIGPQPTVPSGRRARRIRECLPRVGRVGRIGPVPRSRLTLKKSTCPLCQHASRGGLHEKGQQKGHAIGAPRGPPLLDQRFKEDLSWQVTRGNVPCRIVSQPLHAIRSLWPALQSRMASLATITLNNQAMTPAP